MVMVPGCGRIKLVIGYTSAHTKLVIQLGTLKKPKLQLGSLKKLGKCSCRCHRQWHVGYPGHVGQWQHVQRRALAAFPARRAQIVNHILLGIDVGVLAARTAVLYGLRASVTDFEDLSAVLNGLPDIAVLLFCGCFSL